MQELKLNFADFWPHFDKRDNYFTRLLGTKFKVVISEKPTHLIYSAYGTEHLSYDCYRIFYNGENLRTNWNACDYSLSFDYLADPRHFRLPNWFFYGDPIDLLKPKLDVEALLNAKTKFCNIVISNPKATKRIQFFEKLSKYKKVDSGGRCLNNIGQPVGDKLTFIQQYKFTIAFENSSFPGYTTEKLFEPMLVNSLPIYWGNPLVNLDFNTSSFFNHHDTENEDELIEKIIEADKDDSKYLGILKQPWYQGNILPDCMNRNKLLAFLEAAISNKKLPVAKSSRRYLYKAQQYLGHADHILNSKLKYRRHFR